MENKIEFFEKNLKKLIKKELNLYEQNIDINVKVTGIESIPCLIDTCYQLVVIDGYFENLKTFWDTTNVEILAQKIKNQLNIKGSEEFVKKARAEVSNRLEKKRELERANHYSRSYHR